MRVTKFIVLSLLVSGCSLRKSSVEVDRFEPVNRVMFGVNKVIDKALLEGTAKTYVKITPVPIQNSVTQFNHNIHELPTSANDFLQGKLKKAATALARFMINSTLGMLGLVDVASKLNLKYHTNTFGNTLVKWGYTKSSYLVLPILGPSTVRDGIGEFADYHLNVPKYTKASTRNKILTAVAIDKRAAHLEREKILFSNTRDEYSAVRDAYLQNLDFKLKGKKHDTAEADEFLDGPPE